MPPSQALSRKARRCSKLASRNALGAGALGFWVALREVFPETREQRCWFDKIAKVIAALPKSAHYAVKTDLAEVWNAEDRRHGADATRHSSPPTAPSPHGGRQDHRRRRMPLRNDR